MRRPTPVCTAPGCASVRSPVTTPYCARHNTQLKRKGRIVPDRALGHACPGREPRASVRGPSSIAAAAELPEDLRPVFFDLAEDYLAAAHVLHGYAYFSPKILAELVRLGWRRSA